MTKEAKPQVSIDLKTTTPILSPEGNAVFIEGLILRKVSKFLTGSPQDQIMPIPCFFDPKTKKVLVEMLPADLKEEFEKYNESQS